MRKTIATLTLAAGLALSACGVNVTAGTVVDKTYEEAYTTQEEIEDCEWDTDTKKVGGKTKTTREYECEGTGEYEDVEHDAVYTVTLEDKEKNDETHEVSEEIYNSVEVGDFLDLEAK